MASIDKEEWISRAAARFREKAGCDDVEARSMAEGLYAGLDDFDDEPEDVADDDMSYWDDDGD